MGDPPAVGDGRPRALEVEYLAVGHVTADVSGDGRWDIGGSVTYAAAAAAGLGLRAAVVTRHGPDLLPERLVPGVTWHSVPDSVTSTFANVYDGDGRRVQTLRARASSLAPGDIPEAWCRVGVLHVAPVMAEVSVPAVSMVSAGFVGMTAQGWLRRAGDGGIVEPAPWAIDAAMLRRADAVVVSEEDLGADVDRFEWLARQVPVAVLTRGPAGAVAIAGERVLHQPALPARAADPTGAGDVFASVLFVRLWEGAPLSEALSWAAAAGAIAVELAVGWATITRERIADRLAGRR